MITNGILTFSLGWMVLVALTQPKVPKFVLEVLAAHEWLDRLKLKTIIHQTIKHLRGIQNFVLLKALQNRNRLFVPHCLRIFEFSFFPAYFNRNELLKLLYFVQELIVVTEFGTRKNNNILNLFYSCFS
jgi:hypothetical protein